MRQFIRSFWAYLTNSESEDVRDFQLKFKQLVNHVPVHLTRRKLNERAECMQEELDEFKAAIQTQDLAEQADALIDLVYFAKGTANMLGLPWNQLWDDVQRANMSKVAGVGKRGHLVDCIKPPGWRGPMTGLILSQAGYDPTQFQCPATSTILEENCHDDAIHLM